MIIHTIIDEYDVMRTDEKKQYVYQSKNKTIFEGFKDENDFIIQRVISTDLNDYLNPKYNNGNKLK